MDAQKKNIFGPQVRRLRVAANLSQAVLAAICQRIGWDIDRNTIAKIEGRMRWVGDFELLYLAKALKCGLADLLGDTRKATRSFQKSKKTASSASFSQAGG
jgi:transcriptional regulator with XRE-family HTH domain